MANAQNPEPELEAIPSPASEPPPPPQTITLEAALQELVRLQQMGKAVMADRQRICQQVIDQVLAAGGCRQIVLQVMGEGRFEVGLTDVE